MASASPPGLKHSTSPKQDSEKGVVVVDFEFQEEPVGLTAEQGWGFLDIGFGEVLGPPGQRYEILRKLGFGMYSSVWLAKDIQHDRYVALKALTGYATQLVSEGYMQELRVLQRISEGLSPGQDTAHCLLLLSSFMEPAKDQDGNHLCIITSLMGHSVRSLLEVAPKNVLQVPLAKRVLRHILLGLSHIHKCGVVHTDIKPDNIMMDIGAMSTQEIENLIKSDPSRRYPPEPTWGDKTVEVAMSQPLYPPSLCDPTIGSFKIVDFGSAQFCDQNVVDHITTIELRAPETILQCPWNEKVNIWSFGCLIFEFLTGRPLFTLDKKNLRPEVTHLLQMISMTGERFTPSQLDESSAALELFDPETSLLKGWPYIHNKSYQEMMRTYQTVDEKDMDGAAKLMSRCLRLHPEDRASAEELLNDPWLVEL